MDILVVLQSHSKGESQHYMGLTHFKRFVDVPKAEIMRRCTKSLVDTINYAQKQLPDFKFKLAVLDDHSDEGPLNDLRDNLKTAKFDTELIQLETHGIMPSILQCYEYGKKFGKEIVYFAQDDYLYEESAMHDMIMTMIDCSNKLGTFASIYPFDDPYRYIPENTAVTSHVIRCQKRHWRTQNATASCFMVHHQVLTLNWDLFYAMGTHELSGKMEDNTINRLWYERGYHLFVPLPSLAFHMQYDTEKDDIADWETLWKKYAISSE